ncbi:MAG: quinone oxidoreductase [Alphaproteobacteria bacterium]|nr:quinone oxidoreductase [Alphaproteobacteria bacterium]
MKAIQIHETGGAEMLRYEDVAKPQPKAGEVLVRQTAIGINFIDIYFRTGLYKAARYPIIPGMEASGVVEAVGQGVSGFAAGDRVAYCSDTVGGYAEYRALPARWLVKLPNALSDEVAAAVMVKGLTAHYLLRRTFPVKKGDVILLHAAAGGVGLIASQWAKHLGATVIGTVSSEDKAALAKAHGCDHVILYTREKVSVRVRELTEGRGVDVVYDSVGQSTFMESLDSLKKFGMLVSYGNASGPVPAFEPLLLSKKGSVYITRPTLMHHIENEADYRESCAELLDLVARGIIKVSIGGTYKLADAAEAQTDLENRKTTGSLLLVP